jgi:hypothetical protein
MAAWPRTAPNPMVRAGSARPWTIGSRALFYREVSLMELCVFAILVTVQGYPSRLVIDFDKPASADPPERGISTPVEVGLSDADALEFIKAYRLPGADLCPWIQGNGPP